MEKRSHAWSLVGLIGLLIFGVAGCGAVAADVQQKNSTVFYGPIGGKNKERPVEDLMVYNLFVRSEAYPPFKLLTSSSPAYYILGTINWFIPLPSVQIAEFISAEIKGITNADIERVVAALHERSKIEWSNDSGVVVDKGIYFWSEKRNLYVTFHKSESRGVPAYWLSIKGLHGKEILDLIMKELKLSLSQASAETYKNTLSGIIPDSSSTSYTYQDIFSGWK